MFEFENPHSSQERQISFEEQQYMLASSAVWLRGIINDKKDPDSIEPIVWVPATPDALRHYQETGSLTIYDFIDAFYVEYSTFDKTNDRTGITHYLLKQTTGGVWNLQTTHDLYRSTELIFEQIESRGFELDESNERLSLKEPLYPELLEDALPEQIRDFQELIEVGAFGDATFDFDGLDEFLERTAEIRNDIERLARDD